MTLTRSPLGRRASTIGLDSSTRRLTVETMRSIVCMSSASLGEAGVDAVQVAVALDPDLVRAR